MSEPLLPESVTVKLLGSVMRVSRETALMHGLIQPTPEEAAEQESRSREYDQRRRAAWVTYRRALVELTEVTDELARAVIVLHAPNDRQQCQGCDIDGYEAEQPEWPCRTIQAIGEVLEIDLPDPWDLMGPEPQ